MSSWQSSLARRPEKSTSTCRQLTSHFSRRCLALKTSTSEGSPALRQARNRTWRCAQSLPNQVDQDLVVTEMQDEPKQGGNELCLRRDEHGQLVCIMTTHVDDLKIAGVPCVVKELWAVLTAEFGELTIHRGTFTNCGVQHVQNLVTYEITLGPDHVCGRAASQ